MCKNASPACVAPSRNPKARKLKQSRTKSTSRLLGDTWPALPFANACGGYSGTSAGPRTLSSMGPALREPAQEGHALPLLCSRDPAAHVCAPGVITGISQVAWMIPAGFLWNSQRVKGGERRLLLATGVSPARFVR